MKGFLSKALTLLLNWYTHIHTDVTAIGISLGVIILLKDTSGGPEEAQEPVTLPQLLP